MIRWTEYRPENEWVIAVSDSQITYYAVIPGDKDQRDAVEDFIETYQFNEEGDPEALRQELHWVLIDPDGKESEFQGYFNRYGGFVAAY